MDQDKNGFRSDVVMRLVWRRMLEDLSVYLSDSEKSGFGEAGNKLLVGDIPGFRHALEKVRLPYWASANQFKAVAQLKDLTKEYIFVNDMFSVAELSDTSLVKYLETQSRISSPINWDPLFYAGLLEEWRAISSGILGLYDPDEHLQLCRFAKNACVGHPFTRRRLDYKVKGPITGSPFHLEFLRGALAEDPLLARALKGARWKRTTSLQLQFVPKSYKALRAIMPNTLAGSFYSAGLGEVIKARLKAVGLDITRLQNRHRKLAQYASRDYRGGNRRLATLDLSSASDSITVDLLEKILPKKWYSLVMAGRVDKFTHNKKHYALQSACTMGLGHTFPLETLVFYTLVRGIMNWYAPGRRGLVSVYGDDIILPQWAVMPVVTIFKRLHLIVNADKSFWGLCDFRESCGGDFFRGTPVRPFTPELVGGKLKRGPFRRFVYGLANGLLSKGWSEAELPQTFRLLVRLIQLCDGFVLSVPPHFPDDSGFKCEPGTFGTELPETLNWGTYRVKAWAVMPRYSEPVSEDGLLWDTLRVFGGREPDSRLSERSVVQLRKKRRGKKVSYFYGAVDPGLGSSEPENPRTRIVLTWPERPEVWYPEKGADW